MSDYERPFIEDGSQFGISREAFAEMPEEEQRELMIEWFKFNFEDPVQEMPRIDGEYVYPWGGPFDAREQLYEKFETLVSEELIESVVEHVERDGVDWAPTSRGEFYEHPEPDDEPSEPPPLDIYLDEPSDRYGSAEEREARERAVELIDRARVALKKRPAIRRDHNRPPERIDEPSDSEELEAALAELGTELRKQSPSISLVKRWAAPLREAVVATGKWSLTVVKASILAGAVAASTKIGTDHAEDLVNAFQAVIHWLEIAAKTLF